MRQSTTELAGGRTQEEIEALLRFAEFEKVGEYWKSSTGGRNKFDTRNALKILLRRNTCLIIRDRKTAHGTLDLATGKTAMGPTRMETSICNAPLWSDREKKTGVCRSCASGYSVTGNRFANNTERQRAIAAHGMALQPEGVA